MNLEHMPALEEEELNLLGNLLEDECERQDSFDFFATHGALTALLVSPQDFELEALYNLVFEEEPSFSQDEQKNIDELINKLKREITAWLDTGQDFPIPCDLNLSVEEDEDSAPLENWCVGFISVMLSQQDAWYAKEEEKVAKWLFPLMYASGLFLEEEEMAQIDEDEELSNQVCSHIPANVIELYLLYHGQ